MALLEIEELCVFYGRVEAVKGISLRVEEGEVVALLGANGAGKSSTLRAVSGLVRPRTGSIRYRGEEISPVPAHDIVERGIAHVPEGRRLFGTLTVDENLNLGGYRRRSDKKGLGDEKERLFALFPRLRERRLQLAGTLSGGEQQMLAIGRALMASPRLLLLDEPSLGLAPLLVRDIFRTIRGINEQGVTILLVEQNARLALKIANEGYVLETGSIALSGPARRLQEDPRMQRIYLGKKGGVASAEGSRPSDAIRRSQ